MAFITYVKTATMIVTAVSELIRAIHNISSKGTGNVLVNVGVPQIDPHREAVDPNAQAN